ncbi:MAG: hypothetical protein A3A51_01125 [Candidatus Levybacteria bacterium RIFCSPLOWO2_01_FULL_39_10]|nr:MAG: hypothetical protein A3A51_01125 [Candidatus Levybacteria bacterium RIFCSPLOWO2_01_FULL_39_10]
MNLRNFSSIDVPLMVSVGILIIFSLVTLYSINFSLFRNQAVFALTGFLAFLALTQINYRFFTHYYKYIYLGSIIILFLLLFIGVESRGSVRWFELYGLRVQASEILKPFLALSMAYFLSTLKNYSLKSFIVVLLLSIPIIFLIFLQPDLGNALIYFFVVLGTLLIFGFPFKYFLFGFFVWVLTLPLFWAVLRDYQKNRILTFFDPTSDPLGTSYNAIQAIIAVGSGMLLGRGIGQGTQVELFFLPETHTDFIFATISEEFGFVGSAIIVSLFVFILYRIYLIIKTSYDKFSKVFSIVTFLIIFTHFFINIGMNVGILPVVGITLPFVSYGGSSLLSSFILLGLLFSINKETKEKVLEIK